MAKKGDDLLGFATFATMYPVSGMEAFTFVHQIYVGAESRRLGVARKLMAEISRITIARGGVEVQWTTAKSNSAARRFYDSLHAAGEEKIYYTLKGEGLARLAQNRDSTDAWK